MNIIWISKCEWCERLVVVGDQLLKRCRYTVLCEGCHNEWKGIIGEGNVKEGLVLVREEGSLTLT